MYRTSFFFKLKFTIIRVSFIEYIEDELMDRASLGVVDPRIGEAPSPLFIYLYVWDR